jgi:hypothetical protein
MLPQKIAHNSAANQKYQNYSAGGNSNYDASTQNTLGSTVAAFWSTCGALSVTSAPNSVGFVVVKLQK